MHLDSPPTRRWGYRLLAIVIGIVVVTSAISIIFIDPFGLVRNDGKRLELIASESTASVLYSQNLTLRIEVYNNGPTSIFNFSHYWPVVDGVPSRLGISPCSSDFPYGYAVFLGYITNSTLSSAKPLTMWQPGMYSCPALFPVSGYKIDGFSHVGYILSPSNSPVPISLSSDLQLSGYWNGTNPNNGTYILTDFPAGQYTIVVADEWGSVVFLHFQVRAELP